MSIQKIVVFCGSHKSHHSIYVESAIQLVETLVNSGITIVYGGAKVGLMGMLANHALEMGGKVIGVIPQSLVDSEISHESLTELHVVHSMHARKALMSKLSDGVIMLPGGAGTLDEFFETYTWAQLGYHSKPCAILNVNGYYDPLLKLLDHAVSEGFLKSVHRNMLIVEHLPNILLQKMINYIPPRDIKWKK